MKEVSLPLLEARQKSSKIQVMYKAQNNPLPNYGNEKIPATVGTLN